MFPLYTYAKTSNGVLQIYADSMEGKSGFTTVWGDVHSQVGGLATGCHGAVSTLTPPDAAACLPGSLHGLWVPFKGGRQLLHRTARTSVYLGCGFSLSPYPGALANTSLWCFVRTREDFTFSFRILFPRVRPFLQLSKDSRFILCHFSDYKT